MSGKRLPDGYFHAMYEAVDDPWGFTSRWYEQRKYALTLAALPSPRYGSVFEPGCSIGVLSAALAARCERLLCIDVSPRAVVSARRRLASAPHAEVRPGDIVDDWPDGERFDLIVLSEVLYYLDAEALHELIRRLPGSLTPDGEIVAVHWRWPVDEYPQTGDAVHEALRSSSLVVSASYSDTDFRHDLLRARPGRSVAQREGLVGSPKT